MSPVVSLLGVLVCASYGEVNAVSLDPVIEVGFVAMVV